MIMSSWIRLNLPLLSLSCILATATSVSLYIIYHNYAINPKSDEIIIDDPYSCSYVKLIGNTPIIELKKLSAILGREIYVKMESMNPGGTGKDRAAKRMIVDAIHNHFHEHHHPINIVEGTSGSTGIALAGICNALGLKLHVVLPDDQAIEKRRLLETLGATVYIVPVCSISNENHYVNQAKKLTVKLDGIFINQFENLSNYRVHYEETGPELWKQMDGHINAFVMSAGTGGTIAGISSYLKSRDKNIKVILADPYGSSLYQAIKYGVCYTSQQSERIVKKHRYDSIVEGVGLDRMTANFQHASSYIDDSEQVYDQEIVDMAHWLLREEGLFVGSSSAMNVVATCRVAKNMKDGSKIVTIICDSGQRHLSRFWNHEYVSTYGITWPDPATVIPACLQ